MDIEKILAKRADTHGNFWDQANTAQGLKGICRQALIRSENPSAPIVREALDMILVKVARIACGDSIFIDHWEDIQGYAELVCAELRTEKCSPKVKS